MGAIYTQKLRNSRVQYSIFNKNLIFVYKDVNGFCNHPPPPGMADILMSLMGDILMSLMGDILMSLMC